MAAHCDVVCWHVVTAVAGAGVERGVLWCGDGGLRTQDVSIG